MATPPLTERPMRADARRNRARVLDAALHCFSHDGLGAQIEVTAAFTADRTGRIYNDKIAPDQFVAGAATPVPTEQDPVVRTAVEWLHGQGCAGR